MMTGRRVLVLLGIVSITIRCIGGTSVTLDISSPLTPDQEVTAECTADKVFGSEHVIWYLNGVEITDGVQTTSAVNSIIDYYLSDSRVGAPPYGFRGSYCSRPCDGRTVRLAGGNDEHEGRVEIFCDGVWGTACDNGFDMNAAHAVCRQLGYSGAASVHSNAYFGEGSGPIWLDKIIHCPTSDKNSLSECSRYPWGCSSYGSCGHNKDVGVRCDGERDPEAAEAIFRNGDLNAGLGYGADLLTYYDITSQLTFTPTTANNGSILQCHVYGVVRSSTLEVTGGVTPSPARSITPCITPSPGIPPEENILSIDAVEIKGDDNLVNLVISCHVNFTNQPSPYLHTYTIVTENTTLSSSSSASAILSPRPNACIELTCSATNGIGTTSATLTHCPRDKPAEGIISVEFETQEDDDNEPSLNITCRVDPGDQPFPPINTFFIAVDNSVISDSASPMVTIDPQPNTCIDVVCTGINEYGETEATKTYCPSQPELGPQQPGSHILRIQTTEIRRKGNLVTLIITCHVDLSDQPYPHLHTYTITADKDTLSSSSCASAILSPLPDDCINVTCSATNGVGDTLSWMEHCRKETFSEGPIASPFQEFLQKSSTTYVLLIVIFILSIITCLTVLMKRKNVY